MQINIDSELAGNIADALTALASESSTHPDSSKAIMGMVNTLLGAVASAEQNEAKAAIDRQMTAAQARRVAGTVKKNMDAESKLAAERLLNGQGMDDYRTAALMRAQADWPFYVLIANQPDKDVDGVLELLADGCREARRILAGGRESTSSVDRAFMEYERKAAARFLSAWDADAS